MKGGNMTKFVSDFVGTAVIQKIVKEPGHDFIDCSTIRYEKVFISTGDSLSIVEELQKPLELKTGYIMGEGDRLYLFPGCKVSREPLRKALKARGGKIVSKAADATHVFANRNSKQEVVTTTYLYDTPKWEFLENYKFQDEIERELAELPDSRLYAGNYALINTRKGKGLQAQIFPAKKLSFLIKGIRLEDVDLLFSGEHPIYNQDDLLRYTGSVEMDRDMYEQAKRTLASRDVADRNMVLEIMSNCNPEKSAVYLLLLICRYCKEMQVCEVAGFARFKAILNFFALSLGDAMTLDDVGHALRRKGLNTKENQQLLFEITKDELFTNTN